MRDVLLEAGFGISVFYGICHYFRIIKFFQKMRCLIFSESINIQTDVIGVIGVVPSTKYCLLGYSF